MNRLLFCLTVLISVTGPASAGFVNNYPEWQKLSATEQGAYISGVYDQIITKNPFARPGILATVDGLQSCTQELELEADTMVKAVSSWYKENPDKWSLPPKTVFHGSIIAMICKQHIMDAYDKHRPKPE